MAAREYECQLRFYEQGWGSHKWKTIGKPVVLAIDLASTPSKVSAILYAIRERHGRSELIERYELRVTNDGGDVFMALSATAEQLQRHYAGYPANVEADAVPRALAEFTDAQLIGELPRRLAERGTDPVPSHKPRVSFP